MKVLVTGGAGFIGSHVCDLLEAEGHEVVVFDDYSSGYNYISPTPRRSIVQIDISNRLALMEVFRGYQPEGIIHLAAQPSLIRSEQDPHRDAEVNILGTLNMIEIAKRFHVKRFVFSSTSAVKGEPGYYFSDDGAPGSPYGISKLAAESYLCRLASGFSAVILRFGNVYGPRQLPLGQNQLVARAMAHIHIGSEFEIFGDGGQTRDFVYVTDVARAVYLALVDRHDLGGIFNVCSGRSWSVEGILSVISVVTKFSGVWGPPKHAFSNLVGRYRVEMSNKAFADTFNWKPEVGLEDGIGLTSDWWKRKSA